MKFRFLLLIPIIFYFLIPSGFAVQFVSLPQCGSQWGITLCVTAYQIGGDQQHATIQGTVEQQITGLARVLSVQGWVYDQSGTVLGSGVIVNLPLDLAYGQTVPAQAQILSNYSPAQLTSMRIQSVHVRVVAEYCLPYQFWGWSGCWNMPAYQYDRTLTVQELQALYTYYAQ